MMFVELEEKNKLASDQGLLNILRLIEVALSDPQVAADYQLATHLNRGARLLKAGTWIVNAAMTINKRSIIS
ncbi:hypothetical protein QY890_07030 [Latilactobacillus sakei]